MSDKETAPWMRKAAERIAKLQEMGLERSLELRESAIWQIIAAECTAPAPQPDWKKEALALVVLLRAKCSDEEWANMESRFAAATPQLTTRFEECPTCGSVRRDTRKRLHHPTEDAYCFDSWHTREVERG